MPQTKTGAAPSKPERTGGVKSVDRAIDLLELLADYGGESTLSELAEQTSLPLPTIHRLMRALLSRGYVRQLPSRRYTLGPRLMRLGDTASRQFGSSTRPYLTRLADELGESANLAILDHDRAVYVGQASSSHSMRMFTEVGRRVHMHCTGVGKVILAQLSDDEVTQIVERTGLPPATEKSIDSMSELMTELGRIRRAGYGIDDGEQEIGVRCFAVPVPGAPAPTALSISGPDARVTQSFGDRAVPMLQEFAAQIGARLDL